MNWLLDMIFGKLFKALDGYKLYICGAAFVVKGLVELVATYWPDVGLPACEVKTATDDIMIGLSIWAGKSAIVKSTPSDQK